jgi:exodeoxyribonuclease V alpha subunit
VTAVDPEKCEMTVDVPDADGRPRAVVYERKHFENVMHAYASTCHRYQGGQSKAVVVVLLREHFMLLSRPLLYTALTRAEKLCVLVGDPEAVRMALDETRREMRNTTLREHLFEACSHQ